MLTITGMRGYHFIRKVIYMASFSSSLSEKIYQLLQLQITKEGCGKTKSCYSEPADCKASSDCRYLVTIKPLAKGKVVEFELSAKAEWVSIGFDKDKQMVLFFFNIYHKCSYGLCFFSNADDLYIGG